MITLPEKATKPTMYFIGVTTTKSSIMKLFPYWMEILGIDAVIKGIDLPIHADPEEYRRVVDFIKNDELSMGALVTTHKIDIYNAASDMFEYLDPYAKMFGEMSSISKKDGRLEGYAKDPITSGLALEAFLPENYWDKGGDAYILGAGGSAISIGSYILKQKKLPRRLIVSNRSEARLINIEKMFREINPDANMEFYLAPEAEEADKILETLAPNSLVVNATGLGKDRPGSPLSDNCVFPENSLVWEFNYRGDLRFWHQALEQQVERGLYVEDGWIYFLHGWTQVIAEVFHIDMTKERFAAIEKKSAEICGRSKKNDFNFMLPFAVDFDFITGLSKTGVSTKRMLSQMKGMYCDTKAYDELLAEGDRMIYEFYELGCPEEAGQLAFGTSITYPGKVGDEYNMTKGHFHTILATAEVYYCLSGDGYMMMESPEGDVKVAKLIPGQALYVPERYAHRSINTGSDPLVTFFVFRGDAGHNYGTIETKGYRKLIVEKDGKPTVVDNPRWKAEN